MDWNLYFGKGYLECLLDNIVNQFRIKKIGMTKCSRNCECINVELLDKNLK